MNVMNNYAERTKRLPGLEGAAEVKFIPRTLGE